MKKILMILFTLVVTLGLFGCGQSIASAEDYTIDKEVVIEKELTLEDSKKSFEELEEKEDSKYVSCDFKLEESSAKMTMKMTLVYEGAVINGAMDANMSMGGVNINYSLYIKDNYFLLDLGAFGGKMKAEIPADEEINMDDLASYDLNEIIEEFFEDMVDTTGNLKTGYDKNGCLVLDYSDEEIKARFVFDQGYPVYFYAQEGAEGVFEMKFSYEKTSVEFPEGLNLEDYETISWDSLQGNLGM